MNAALVRRKQEPPPFSHIESGGIQKEVSLMTASRVTPFEVFRSLFEFYPRLSANLAFGSMAAAVRMLPISGSASEVPPVARAPARVAPATNARPRKRKTVQKASRKTTKRASGRRRAA